MRIAKYSYKHLAWIKIAAPWDRGRPAQCRIVFAGRGAEKSDRIVDLDLDLDVDLDVDQDVDLDVDLDVDGIWRALLSLSSSKTCNATKSTSTSKSRSRSRSRSQNRNWHAKMEFQKNYAALGVPPPDSWAMSHPKVAGEAPAAPGAMVIVTGETH